MRRLKLIILLVIIIISGLSIQAEGLVISNFTKTPIKITPDKSTGLDAIYVVNSCDDLILSYESVGAGKFEWLQFSKLGAAYAEEVKGLSRTGNTYFIEKPTGNQGFLINDNSMSYSFWLVDYSSFKLTFNELAIDESSGCDLTVLRFNGKAEPITYHTLTGGQEILSRDIVLTYNTLSWASEKELFEEQAIQKTYASLSDIISISPAVLASTSFELKGDKFLQYWDEGKEIVSEIYKPVSVSVMTRLISENEAKDNEISGSQVDYGGSAPYNVKFLSFVTDAVLHFEWQFSKDADFSDVINRFYDQDLDYSFTEEGETYVRFIGSNADGSCEAESDVYKISIGTSELLISNAFSPNGDGINDEWKVAYRSLIEFKCWIFDRYGHKIFYFEDPSQGWDGKNGTKFVKPGVYYYVIEALGADGKKYKKSGDINIVNVRNTLTNSYE